MHDTAAQNSAIGPGMTVKREPSRGRVGGGEGQGVTKSGTSGEFGDYTDRLKNGGCVLWNDQRMRSLAKNFLTVYRA